MEEHRLIPRHIAIIMDGNGRWAKARGLPRIVGHKQGAENIKPIIETAIELGVKHLTLYTFSAENWKRSAEEIEGLMGLLTFYLDREMNNLCQNNVRFRVLGDISRLSSKIVAQIKQCEDLTANNNKISLNLALNYGSRQEIVDATKKIVAQVVNGFLNPEKIEVDNFSKYLYTDGIDDPDLLIRTSGEQRLSNFLLWQSAYTELFFTKVYWPDFTPNDLKQAITEFQTRERRYGTA
jgi:undecaprenyl diphosphate synthase